MWFGSLYFVLALGCLAQAVPSESDHRVKESITTPRGWVKRERAPADHTIELRVAIPQSNFAELERRLYEVSDPSHHRYGEHLSKKEVDELVAPHPESVDSVHRWLATHGFEKRHLTISSAGDWVKLVLPISRAEQMLDTEYHVWEHRDTGMTAIRTTAYSLPGNLHSHVELVHPTIAFPSVKPMISGSRFIPDSDAPSPKTKIYSASAGNSTWNSTIDIACNNEIGLKCLQQIYNLTDYEPSPNSGSRLGITGYLEQFANMQDLQTFFKEQRPDAANTTFDVISINGGMNSQNLSEAGTEANLDIQYGVGLSTPLPVTFYTTGGRPPFQADSVTPVNNNEPYLDWLDSVLNQTNPPQVISTSYGDVEQTVPESYARLVCNGFAQLGARGVSLIFSSGDNGVGDGDTNPKTQTCQTNDGRNQTEFLPVFPASCPYVTAVGATYRVPEVVAEFSGGGFSNIFSRPSYQEAAVAKYLGNLPKGTHAGLYNGTGRAYPDISAQGVGFTIWSQGRRGHVLGTSASAPTVASIFALLNDARLRNGLPALGFLNPLLYKIYSDRPEALNDITQGSNPGCGTKGFNATQGWDPVTGLGTPNFGKWKDTVLSAQYGDPLKTRRSFHKTFHIRLAGAPRGARV